MNPSTARPKRSSDISGGKSNKKGSTLNVLIWITALLTVLMFAMLAFRMICHDRAETPFSNGTDLAGQLTEISLAWTAEDTAFSGTLSRLESGVYEITVKQPETVAGLKMTYDPTADKCTVSYMGMSTDISDGLPIPESYIKIIGSAIQNAVFEEGAAQTDNGVLTEITGTVGENNYSLILDQTGTLQKLTVPKLGISCTFYNETE